MKKIALVLVAAVILVVGLVSVAAARPGNRGPQALPGVQMGGGMSRLGIVVADLNSSLAQSLGLSRDSGVVILSVLAGSLAEKASLQPRDIITKLNGSPVTSIKDFLPALRKATGEVTLTVLRGSQEQDIKVTPAVLQARPQAGLGSLRAELGIEPGKWFDHCLKQELTVTDKDGKVHVITITPGVVKEIGVNSLTITPNGQTAPVTYTITDKTGFGPRIDKLDQLKAGDRVRVVTLDGSQEARLVLGAGGAWGGWRLQPRQSWSPRAMPHMPFFKGKSNGQGNALGRGKWGQSFEVNPSPSQPENLGKTV